MARNKKEDRFIKKPIYPGGLTAMREFLKSEIKYPKAALEAKIEGSVYIRYGIDYKGSVSEVNVLQGLGHGCDEEAVRLVKLFKFQVPKIPRRLKVAFNKTIRIHFKLPKAAIKKMPEKPSAPKQFANSTYSYTITPSTKRKDEAPSQKKSSYTYTIKY